MKQTNYPSESLHAANWPMRPDPSDSRQIQPSRISVLLSELHCLMDRRDLAAYRAVTVLQTAVPALMRACNEFREVDGLLSDFHDAHCEEIRRIDGAKVWRQEFGNENTRGESGEPPEQKQNGSEQ